MYAIAVELSDTILNDSPEPYVAKMILWLVLLPGVLTNFMASFIARSSNQFMSNVFSESDHLPLIVWSS